MHVSIFSFSEMIDPSWILLLSFVGRLLEVSVEGRMNLLHNGWVLHDSCLHFHRHNSIKDESSHHVVYSTASHCWSSIYSVTYCWLRPIPMGYSLVSTC